MNHICIKESKIVYQPNDNNKEIALHCNLSSTIRNYLKSSSLELFNLNLPSNLILCS